MVDYLSNELRTKMCGQFDKSDIDKKVTVMGFVAKYRNLGTLLFADVRDRTGIVQVSFNKIADESLFDKSAKIKNEFVICVTGVVKSRGEKNINTNIPTGEIEIIGEQLLILSEAETTPFVISDDANVNEVLRLKYRYLDLRRPYLQSRLIMRDKVCRCARNYLADNGFLEIETPFLGKSTPEGARDYLVPSRLHLGEFYALPQSPQIFKQLLMISGFDRYYQIARCFRDEDLRANRQPEFSQIDLEMSFVKDQNCVMSLAEGLIKHLFKECLNLSFTHAFEQMTYNEAMETYGSDKPDRRFAMHINNVSDVFKNSQFVNFSDALSGGGSVSCIVLENVADKLTRKNLDELCDYVRSCKAKGLYYVQLKSEGATSSFQKFLSADNLSELIVKAKAKTNDIIFIVAEQKADFVLEVLGQLRCYIAKKYNLIDENVYDILWVKDFPLLQFDAEENRYVAMHHPFTSPKIEDIGLIDTAPEKIKANAYDLVINGQEAGGGSIRIHDTNMQKKMFELIGLSNEDITERFGFFVEAFKYGTPPHGGLAFGLDRLVMLLTKTESIKDVIAFPKMQNANCLMTQAPSKVENNQLKELNLIINENS